MPKLALGKRGVARMDELAEEEILVKLVVDVLVLVVVKMVEKMVVIGCLVMEKEEL